MTEQQLVWHRVLDAKDLPEGRVATVDRAWVAALPVARLRLRSADPPPAGFADCAIAVAIELREDALFAGYRRRRRPTWTPSLT